MDEHDILSGKCLEYIAFLKIIRSNSEKVISLYSNCWPAVDMLCTKGHILLMDKLLQRLGADKSLTQIRCIFDFPTGGRLSTEERSSHSS